MSESLDPDRTALSIFETAPGAWNVSCYCSSEMDKAALGPLVEAAAGADAAASLSFESIAEEDWVAASLAGLPPVFAGRFVIHGAHDRARIPANRVAIEIEAALAFGTGHHGTTRGCLLALDDVLKRRRPQRILDVGTGTGVLAMAAALALRRRVLATDSDRQAVRTARANARLNRAANHLDILWANGATARRIVEAGPYDLILANILQEPLKRMARPLARRVAPQGRVILSGLLPGHVNAVRSTYRMQGLALERVWLVDGWATLVLRRGRSPTPKNQRPGLRSAGQGGEMVTGGSGSEGLIRQVMALDHGPGLPHAGLDHGLEETPPKAALRNRRRSRIGRSRRPKGHVCHVQPPISRFLQSLTVIPLSGRQSAPSGSRQPRRMLAATRTKTGPNRTLCTAIYR